MFFNFLVLPDILTTLKKNLTNFETRTFGQGLRLNFLIVLTEMLQTIHTGLSIQIMNTYRHQKSHWIVDKVEDRQNSKPLGQGKRLASFHGSVNTKNDDGRDNRHHFHEHLDVGPYNQE